MSWVHEKDILGIVRWVRATDVPRGTYNGTALQPVSNQKFMQFLRKEMGISIGLRVPEWMLKIGAFFLRTEPELVLESRNVVPERLVQEGFQFEYERVEDAFKSLLKANIDE